MKSKTYNFFEKTSFFFNPYIGIPGKTGPVLPGQETASHG
jgi:hypothetical protein